MAVAGMSDVEMTLHLRFVEKTFYVPSDYVGRLLGTLGRWHAHGYVHGDVRIDNVVKYYEDWILLDWELAGESGLYAWWEGKVLPEDVRTQRAPYTCQTDLWQLGVLIKRQAAGDAANKFGAELVDGKYNSADAARQHLCVCVWS